MKRKCRNGRSRRAERMEQALARVEAWQKLSPTEQLNRLPVDGAAKQRARIMAKLEKEKPVSDAVAPVVEKKKKKK